MSRLRVSITLQNVDSSAWRLKRGEFQPRFRGAALSHSCKESGHLRQCLRPGRRLDEGPSHGVAAAAVEGSSSRRPQGRAEPAAAELRPLRPVIHEGCPVTVFEGVNTASPLRPGCESDLDWAVICMLCMLCCRQQLECEEETRSVPTRSSRATSLSLTTQDSRPGRRLRTFTYRSRTSCQRDGEVPRTTRGGAPGGLPGRRGERAVVQEDSGW